jgi:peroxiredoxin
VSRKTTSYRAQKEARRRIPAEFFIIVVLILVVGLAGSLWYFVVQPSLASSNAVPGPSTALGTVSQPVATASPAPDFTTRDLAGNTVRLSDYRGQPVVLNAWATWCGPCRLEMPDLEKFYQEYHEQGVVVLAVNMGESKDTVATFIKDNKYTFPVLLDETTAAVGRPYRISGIPATFFIDRQGKIASIQVGAMNLAEMKRRIAAIL